MIAKEDKGIEAVYDVMIAREDTGIEAIYQDMIAREGKGIEAINEEMIAREGKGIEAVCHGFVVMTSETIGATRRTGVNNPNGAYSTPRGLLAWLPAVRLL